MNKYFFHLENLKPKWEKENITFEEATFGLLTYNYYIKYKDKKEYFLKIYRHKNSNVDKYTNINKLGFGGKILYTFDEGHIEELLDGKNPSYQDFNGDFYKQIAIEIRKYHQKTNMNHNNLNMSNIILNDNSLKIINYEFSDDLNIYYDLANFLVENIYNYNNKEWYRYDLSKFPSKCHFDLFCKEYFQENNIELLEIHQNKILNEIQNVINFWINWIDSFAEPDYILYKLYRKKLLDINFKNLFNNKVIYCDGCFDLPHTGHLSFFKKIFNLSCKKLLVGILSDENVASYKRTPILNLQTRSEIISSFKYVNNIIKDCPFNRIEKSFLDFYGIDLVVYGGDPNIKDPLGTWEYHYSIPFQENCLRMIDYSSVISTSWIIDKINNKI